MYIYNVIWVDCADLRAPGVLWRPFWGKIWKNPKIIKNRYFCAVFFFKRVSVQRRTLIFPSKPVCATGPRPAPYLKKKISKFENFLKKSPFLGPSGAAPGAPSGMQFFFSISASNGSINSPKTSFLLQIVFLIFLKNLRGAILAPLQK